MSTPPSTFEVRADHARNILYITLTGYLSAEQVKQASQEVIRKAKTMQPGFSVINDIQSFRPVSQDVVAYVAEAQRAVVAAGAHRIVRVTGSTVVANMQFSRTSREVGYDAASAATVADAEALITRAARAA